MDLTRTWEEQKAPQAILPAQTGEAFTVWDWSPDGKKLVGTLPFGANAVAVYSFETRRLERIVENVNTVPSWLPDSRHIIYDDDDRFFIADTETKKTKEILYNTGENIRAPFISRDGQLLYYSVHSSESNIWLLDAGAIK